MYDKLVVLVLALCSHVQPVIAARLPFKNPITMRMMQNNDGAEVRKILEDLDSREEAGNKVKQMIFNAMLVDLNPLQSAAKYNAPDVVTALLDHGAEINSFDSKTESTPLIIAAREGSDRALRILLERGAEVNRKDKDGRTGLMLAAIDGHLLSMELLLANKADANLKENRGNTALHIAAFYCQNPKVVDLLLTEGASIDTVDDRKHSAIWLAASAGQQRCVSMLLERGADFSLVDDDNLDAASRAAEKGHLEIAQLLKKAAGGQATEL